MLPKQAVTYGQLINEGLSGSQIKNLSASLKLFPTPFKGIYYVPSPEEKKAWFIDGTHLAMKKILQLYLKTNEFYFSCSTAEEFIGSKWTPSGEVHVVNIKRSGKIDIRERIRRNEKKKTFRAKKIAAILSYYGNTVVFHKVNSIRDAKFKETPYGRYASESQMKADKKRFREMGNL